MQRRYESSNNWRVIPLAIDDQQKHIDLSEQLLTEALPGDPATFYWSLARPEGLVLGFSQKPEVLNRAFLAEHPLPIYHRRAGGTAVLVGPNLLSLDVVLPAGHPLLLADLVESYRWLGEAWVETLAAFGIMARAVSPAEAHAQRDLLKQEKQSGGPAYESLLRRACYGSLSPYEVVIGQQKVVGLDMIRRRAGSLLQAGVLLQWETEKLALLLGHTEEEQAILRQGLPTRACGLNTLLPRPITPTELITAFERVVRALLM